MGLQYEYEREMSRHKKKFEEIMVFIFKKN